MAETATTSVVIAAVDKATEVIKNITGQFDALDNKWGKLVSALGIGAAFTGLTALVKSSLEAADRMNDLAQITGVSVETLSGFSVAAKTSGLDIESLAQGIAKMSKGLIDADDDTKGAAQALGALGINAQEFIRLSVEDRIYVLADAFAETEDGAGKTAAAMAIFGKAGAQMIPFLNQGADGLREMKQIAEDLGIALDTQTAQAADRVSDTFEVLKMSATGMGNQILRAVLPTLEGLAQMFLEAKREGGFLNEAISVLVGGGFKALVSAAMSVFGVLKSIGTILGAVAAAAVQMGSGNLRTAWDTLKAGVSDAGAALVQTKDQITAVWTESMPKLSEATLKAAKPIGEFAKATKQAKDNAAELKATLLAEIATLEANTLSATKLSDAEKLLLKIEDAVAAGKAKLTLAERIEIAGRLAHVDATLAARKALEDFNTAQDKAQESFRKATEKITEQSAKLEEEARNLGLTKEQVAALDRAQRDAEIARLQSLATSDLVLTAGEAERQNILDRIAALQRLNEAEGNLAAKGAMVDAAKKTQEEWKKAADSIENALTQALVDGFNSGKSILKSVGDYIVNYFKTTIARGIAQAIMGAIGIGASGSAFAGMFGGAATSAGGAAAGGMLGNVGGGLLAGGSLGAYLNPLSGGVIGTAIPVLGGLWALSSLFGGGETRYGAQYGIQGGSVVKLEGPSGGDPQAQQTIAAITDAQNTINQLVQTLGGTVAGTISRVGYEFSKESEHRFTEIFVNGIGRRQWGYGSNEAVAAAFGEDLKRAVLLGLQQSDIKDEFKSLFSGIDVMSASGADIDKVLAAVIAKAQEVAKPAEEIAQNTYEVSVVAAEVLEKQLTVLSDISAGLIRLADISDAGLAAAAHAASSAGDQVANAVGALASRPINVTIMSPEVNGGITGG